MQFFCFAVSAAPLQPKKPKQRTHSNSRARRRRQPFKPGFLDWYGSYNGVLPCADCQGIKTRITLRKDNTFTKTVKYLGKDSRARFSRGTIQWDDQGSTITLAESRGKAGRYKVGENILFHLDRNGNMITGDSAQKYQLMKNAVDPDIENITWYCGT